MALQREREEHTVSLATVCKLEFHHLLLFRTRFVICSKPVSNAGRGGGVTANKKHQVCLIAQKCFRVRFRDLKELPTFFSHALVSTPYNFFSKLMR